MKTNNNKQGRPNEGKNFGQVFSSLTLELKQELDAYRAKHDNMPVSVIIRKALQVFFNLEKGL